MYTFDNVLHCWATFYCEAEHQRLIHQQTQVHHPALFSGVFIIMYFPPANPGTTPLPCFSKSMVIYYEAEHCRLIHQQT